MRILNSSGWKLRVVIWLEWVLLFNIPSSPPEALHWNTGLYRFQYHSRTLSVEMLSSTLFSSVPQSSLTLCDPVECSMPGFPVRHQLLELAQTPVHWVGDAIQPSHPLLSPSPPAFNLPPASGSFPVSQFFASSGQSIGASASASVLPINIQGWFPVGWTGWISLQFKGLSRFFSSTTVQNHQSFHAQLSLRSNSHIHTSTGEIIALIKWTIVSKVMTLLFNMLSKVSHSFSSKIFEFHGCRHHLQWFWSPRNKVCHCFHCFPICLPWSDGIRCRDLSFLNVELQANFFKWVVELPFRGVGCWEHGRRHRHRLYMHIPVVNGALSSVRSLTYSHSICLGFFFSPHGKTFYFKYGSVYMAVPNSQSIPLHNHSLLITIHSFSKSMSLLLSFPTSKLSCL